MQSGMEAIASSLSNRQNHEEPVSSIALLLQEQHKDNQRFQAVQLNLLERLLEKTHK